MKSKQTRNQDVSKLAWMLICIFCISLFSPNFAAANNGGFTKSNINTRIIASDSPNSLRRGATNNAPLLASVISASNGGPTQPEVQGFTPIGVSDMVDPFTGDFSYNIPLMDVEGYPINIAYNSGITMDQEASWVGLGWNLNVGSIQRNLRGLPDDFNKDIVEKVVSQKPQVDVGVSIQAGGIELFGANVTEMIENAPFIASVLTFSGLPTSTDQVVQNLQANNNSFSLNFGANINYSNYRGWGVGFNVGTSFNLKKYAKADASFGLGLSLSSENGPGFSPSVSLSSDAGKKARNNESTEWNVGLGSTFNSRAGLRDISYDASLKTMYNKNDATKKSGMGAWAAGSSYQIGLRNYSPSAGPSMINAAFSGNFTLTGITIFGSDAHLKMGLNINSTTLASKEINNPAYGFFHLNEGQHNKNALLDFNRDNDATFTQYTPYLASAHLTADIFSVQAQGISGSYRGYRNEVGFVFDPATYTSSGSGNLGFEFGLGGTSDTGFDFAGAKSSGYSGVWSSNSNEAKQIIKYKSAVDDLENFALQEANESSVDTDDLFGTTFSKNNAEKFDMSGIPRFASVEKSIDNVTINQNARTERIKRNQMMSFLTVKEVTDGLGLQDFHPDFYQDAEPHHIGEITQLGTDGRRYVFGLPAYSHTQYEATMAVGENMSGVYALDDQIDYYGGLFDLGNDFSEYASTENKAGIDRYFSSTTTPPYAHSFMLTAVLSDDYIDSDDIKGPSNDDIGTYVKFDYEKVEGVKWRNPVEKNTVYFNEGLKTDKKDDKGSFIYGEKDLWYVKTIETKNYVAVFVCEDRLDGASASGKSGGLNPSDGKMKALRKISLYPKPANYQTVLDLTGLTPIQEVVFNYKYSLCPEYVSNPGGGGKLTLDEIYFTYQGSYKMKRSSYKFEYKGGNAPYDMKAVDRWGTYKPNGTGTAYDPTSTSDPIPNGDHPYTTQNEAEAKSNASQWHLTDIHLPSGGKIHVDYESDDYAYVQNKRASQMYPISMVEETVLDYSNADQVVAKSISDNPNKNRAIYIKIKPNFTKASDYVKIGELVYFKTMVNVGKAYDGTGNDLWELIGGYGTVTDTLVVGDYLKIGFQGEKLMDIGGEDYSPITKQAIQFARMNLSRTINDVDVNGPSNNSENGLANFAGAVAQAITTFDEIFVGPNLGIYNNKKCRQILTNRSFIRLLEPTGHKYGGGVRVKAIKMYDRWKEMVDGGTPDPTAFSFGQQYSYSLENGMSSGVASYEPSLGGDENSLFKPEPYNNRVVCAPDEDMYFEMPIMESQFPSPVVGYSRVVVTDITGLENSVVSTGKVVKEFYTAKDFPVFVQATDLTPKHASSFIPFSPKYEFMTASQGFRIELNDMHGKAKAEFVYNSKQDDPISSVKYEYQCDPITYKGEDGFRLTNNVEVINKNGSTQTAEIGVKYEAVADFRESKTNSVGFGPIDGNINTMFAGPWFLVIPTIWGKIDISEDRLRTATLNKVVNKFGILKSVTADQDGSIVTTKNLAYDAETGQVLATETANNFNDAIFNLSYPAHWKYEQMGAAYKNIGYSIQGFPVGADGFVPCGSASQNFVEGDEVSVASLSATPNPYRAWVTEVNSSGIRILDKDGEAVSAANVRIKILRSGRKNKQMTTMFNISTNENPVANINQGTFTKVLNSGAVEFKENWSTYCNCFENLERGYGHGNPFALGTKGNWRPYRSYTYLTERSQTNTNGNSNIRRDGVFTSFSPFYFFINGDWSKNQSNWTFVSEVSHFSPNGNTLETEDALGRYSSSLMSYRNSLTTAVSANAALNQLAEASFEDFNYRNCMDQSIFFNIPANKISTEEFHSGRNSLHVTENSEVNVFEAVSNCQSDLDCSITLTAISPTTYQLTGVVDDYSVQVVSGSGTVVIDDVTNILTVNNTSNSQYESNYFEVIVTIVDEENDCTMVVKFYTTPPSFTSLNMEILSTNSN